jgi:sugar fermentation stimulation protein A
VEVKSVTLVRGKIARFPDAPTLRGTRHVEELEHLVENKEAAAVVFVIQRSDARKFRPNDSTDPGFGQALRSARRRGVSVFAYRCLTDARRIRIHQAVPVDLEPFAGPPGRAGIR